MDCPPELSPFVVMPPDPEGLLHRHDKNLTSAPDSDPSIRKSSQASLETGPRSSENRDPLRSPGNREEFSSRTTPSPSSTFAITGQETPSRAVHQEPLLSTEGSSTVGHPSSLSEATIIAHLQHRLDKADHLIAALRQEQYENRFTYLRLIDTLIHVGVKPLPSTKPHFATNRRQMNATSGSSRPMNG